MKRFIGVMLLFWGVMTYLCGGCTSGCARSHFGTGGMAHEPGTDPLDNPRYARLLQIDQRGRAMKVGGLIVVFAAGIFLILAYRADKRRANPPDEP